ncbi:MAG: SsrA-binding protein SmpB [Candidatus Babeliales bacterium]
MGIKIIAQNKKAFHDYEILERLEAGIVLTGDEVKSIRKGHISLVGSYAVFHDRELMLLNCTIAPYEQAFQKRDDLSTRSRKLLMHRRELDQLAGGVAKKGITIVPLKMYLNEKGLIKIELGIAKHKKAADKRRELKERDIKKETAREIKKHR